MKSAKLDPINLALRNSSMLAASNAGASSKALGKEYGLHPDQVNRILRGERAKANDESKNRGEGSEAKWKKKAGPLPAPLRKRIEKIAKRHSPASRVNGKPRNSKPGALEATIALLRKLPPATALHPKEIAERLAAKKLWKPPAGGKTPFATLWSNILSEMKKGRQSRIRKVSPGRFGLTKIGRAG